MSIMSPSTNETSAIVSVWSCPAVPTPALPPNPSLIWQLLPGPGNMPPGTFFSWAPTFLLIASVPCGATVHTLPETSSQVMPAAHCHISSSPDYSSIAHERWREGGCLGLWVVSGNKRRGIVGPAAQQKLSQCYSEKKNIRELSRIKSLEKESACKMDDLNSSDMVYVISKI